MLIVVTGTPGTGKSTASEALARRLGAGVLHISEFVEERGLGSGYDRKTQSESVDVRKLEGELRKEFAKLGTRNSKLIVEGHLACEIKLNADFVFVLRCSPKILEKRMGRRGYPPAKIRENMLAEMLDYCTQNAEGNYPRAKLLEIETWGRTAAETARMMADAVGGKGAKCAKVDYHKELKEFLRLKQHGRP